MGISKHLKNPSLRRRKDEITPDDVTEQSLQVWLGLPSKIRRDPSLVSFQMEHERLHGDSELILCICNQLISILLFSFCSTGHDDEPAGENPDEIEEVYDNEEDPTEFITMGIPMNTSNTSSFRSQKFSDPPSDM